MNKRLYEDILAPRRNERSNWLWTSRALDTKVAYKIVPKPTPQYHKESVLNNEKIDEFIERVCRQQNVEKETVKNEVKLILDEIGFDKSIPVIRWLAFMLTKILLKTCSGLYVNHEGLLKIKEQMGNCPVIFVPSHRSYADFIIFSYVCFFYDIEIPAIAAGMDFQGMLGMGEMLRNTGAFYMRRSYNSDSLYWAAFKEYVYQLVAKGDLPIEFFIEGTRSRSNKTAPPKYGLINMILKAYFLGQVPDILFVPVSINYDRILEERLFAFELLGIPKPKESTSGFFKSLSILKEHYGNIYFHFGEPISVRDFFENKLGKTRHSFGPIRLHEINEEEKRAIPNLAYEIVGAQQTNGVVSVFNLIALILNNNVTRGERFTALPDLYAEIRTLKRALSQWGAVVPETDVEQAVEECLKVHQGLICRTDNGAIGLVSNRIVVGKLDPDKLKGHTLSEDTVSYSVPFVMLQIYANAILHYLVDAALVVIILKSAERMTKDELFRRYYNLRALFAFEFVLLESHYKAHFEKALEKLGSERLIECQNDEFSIASNDYFEEVLISSIQPFILTYYGVAETLLTLPEKADEKAILANVQRLFEDAISEKKIFIHPYCMALDTLGNSLSSLVTMKIVSKARRNGKNVYKVDKDLVKKLKYDLETYIPSFHTIKSLDVFLHVKSKL